MIHTAMRAVALYIILSIFPLPSLAYAYSVRHAFCTDYARGKSSIYSSSFQYDLQVAYNDCMKDANNRIRLHEQRKKESADRSRREQAEWRQRKRQEEQTKRQEEQRLKNMTENLSDIFR